MPEIDFDKIALSKDEQDALNELSKHNLLCEGKVAAVLNRLVHFGLAETFQSVHNQKLCLAARINDNGKDYIAYSRKVSNESREKRLHDWKIAIFSTIGGALLSQPLWDSIEWLLALASSLFRK